MKAQVTVWKTEKPKRQKKPKKREYVPNSARAVTNGHIVTIYQGKRIVRYYTSGQPLVGRIPEDEAPPFTGYVRGWFQ